MESVEMLFHRTGGRNDTIDSEYVKCRDWSTGSDIGTLEQIPSVRR